MTQALVADCAEIRPITGGVKALAIVPKWARAKFIEAYLGIGRDVLLGLVARGFVRMRKANEGRQGTAIFRVSDVEEAIEKTLCVCTVDETGHVVAQSAAEGDGDDDL